MDIDEKRDCVYARSDGDLAREMSGRDKFRARL